MGTHHATTHRVPLLWGWGDRPCLGVPVQRSRTRGAVCACVSQCMCSAERDEEAVGRL